MSEARDMMRLDSPAAQNELKLLATMQVGSVRKGGLFPALADDIDWTCTLVEPVRWKFEGRFFGQPVFDVSIEVNASMLTFTLT